jgi:hypothetical protein
LAKADATPVPVPANDCVAALPPTQRFSFSMAARLESLPSAASESPLILPLVLPLLLSAPQLAGLPLCSFRLTPVEGGVVPELGSTVLNLYWKIDSTL